MRLRSCDAGLVGRSDQACVRLWTECTHRVLRPWVCLRLVFSLRGRSGRLEGCGRLGHAWPHAFLRGQPGMPFSGGSRLRRVWQGCQGFKWEGSSCVWGCCNACLKVNLAGRLGCPVQAGNA